MKSITVFCTILSVTQLFTQAEYVKSKTSELLPKELPTDAKTIPLKHSLAEITSGISSSKNVMTDMNHLMKSVKQEMFDFTHVMLKKCDYDRIEGNISYLTNVTVDLVFNVSDALQSISDKANECASQAFPKSLSCFLQLVNTCKVDIEEIRVALSVYTILARSTALNIFSDFISCYMS